MEIRGEIMSAHACIRWGDVPQPLVDSSRQHVDTVTQAQLVAFNDCPFVGEIDQLPDHLQVSFPFPRDIGLRNSLIDWLIHWGINFTVQL
jgi:hypothetical protein